MRLVSPITVTSPHRAVTSPSSLASRVSSRCLSLSRAANGWGCMSRVYRAQWRLLYVRACVFRHCARACIHACAFYGVTVYTCVWYYHRGLCFRPLAYSNGDIEAWQRRGSVTPYGRKNFLPPFISRLLIIVHIKPQTRCLSRKKEKKDT